jgi:predicted kinase
LAIHGFILEACVRTFATQETFLSCHGWFATDGLDCSGPAICVTSLNMRKWMRERLERRKKKATEQESQPAPPPLQPAYFDADPSAAESSQSEVEAEVISEPQVATEPVREETASEESNIAQSSQPKSASAAQRTKGRRRRGGRGRGNRGREQAVAQAFAPAAGKGTVAEAPESLEDSEPAAAEAAAPEAPSPVPQAPSAPAAVPTSPARPPKGIVVLAIGLPGSGKSSWFKRHNVVPLSSDMVRSLLFDDVREQRFQDLVFSNLRSMLKARLIAKRPMNYVDATNLTPQERQHWIKLAKDYNYEVHAVFFDVPLEVCVERHQRRDRVVPEDVMRRMAAKLKPPSFNEGFAKITVVRVKKKEEEPVNAS